MTNKGTGTAGAHILVFPYPAQGHMIPLLDLTHQLANAGLTITILVTPKNLPLLNPLLAKNPSINTLVLPFPRNSLLPPGIENSSDLPVSYFIPMIKVLADLHDPLLHWFKSHPAPPVAIISDMFLGWTHLLASQLGIPRLVFSPSGALALSVVYSLWHRMPSMDEEGAISFPEIPHCPKFPWQHVSRIYRAYVKGDPVMESLKAWFLGNTASWGLVLNSFNELEGVYLDHLKNYLGHVRVWAVGPVLPESGPAERGGSSSLAVDDVMAWLDDRAGQNQKVVYVCFGSQAVLRNDQMVAVASGLEKSGVHFLWSVKEPTKGQDADQYGKVPSGFEDRVAGRGLIIRGWAPQVSILSHRAVGAFLTHCGWNSVLEAMVAGVPLLAWPMSADQFVNAALLVDELNVGIRACEGPTTVPESDELARVLAESVSENRVERVRAKELSKAALDAVKEGGSSDKDVDGLVQQLNALQSRGEQGKDLCMFDT